MFLRERIEEEKTRALEPESLQRISGRLADRGIGVHAGALDGGKNVRPSKPDYTKRLDGHETDHRTAVLDRGDQGRKNLVGQRFEVTQVTKIVGGGNSDAFVRICERPNKNWSGDPSRMRIGKRIADGSTGLWISVVEHIRQRLGVSARGVTKGRKGLHAGLPDSGI